MTAEDPLDRLERAGYARLLERTASLYECVTFEILDAPDLLERSFCLLRHDIDFSPDAALAVARIEAEQGLRATYMVLLTGEFYSPFERRSREALQAIADMGHEIGLHFDAAWHGIEEEAGLERALLGELAALRSLLPGVPLDTFSFHNTTPFTMACRAPRYAGLRNAYAAPLHDAVAYVSDSNGYWRFRTWREMLDEAPPRLQVLTHPEWWGESAMNPSARAAQIISARAERTWTDYCAGLAAHGRINVGHEQPAGAAAAGLDWAAGRRTAVLAELYAAAAARGEAARYPRTAEALRVLAAGAAPGAIEAALDQAADELGAEA